MEPTDKSFDLNLCLKTDNGRAWHRKDGVFINVKCVVPGYDHRVVATGLPTEKWNPKVVSVFDLENVPCDTVYFAHCSSVRTNAYWSVATNKTVRLHNHSHDATLTVNSEFSYKYLASSGKFSRITESRAHELNARHRKEARLRQEAESKNFKEEQDRKANAWEHQYPKYFVHKSTGRVCHINAPDSTHCTLWACHKTGACVEHLPIPSCGIPNHNYSGLMWRQVKYSDACGQQDRLRVEKEQKQKGIEYQTLTGPFHQQGKQDAYMSLCRNVIAVRAENVESIAPPAQTMYALVGGFSGYVYSVHHRESHAEHARRNFSRPDDYNVVPFYVIARH